MSNISMVSHRSGALPVVTHKTGIPISSVDISPQRTHAVVAGREILKTVRVTPDHCAEETNIRASVIGFSSTHHASPAISSRNREHLAAKDVKWSHSEYSRIIATAASNGRIVIYDLFRPGAELARFYEHTRQVHRLAFNPHRAAWLLSGSQDGTVRMWDLRMIASDRAVVNVGSKCRFNSYNDAVRDIRWSPSDTVGFATATDSGFIQQWDIRKENVPVMKINAHEKACTSVDWHPDGKHLVSASVDRHVKVWDFGTSDRRQKPRFQLRAPQSVSNVRWRPPSRSNENQATASWESAQIVTSYDQEDPRIHIWDLRRPHIPYKEFDRYNHSATDMLWHSSDVLWSVNSEGIFMQTDISFIPEVAERRPVSCITWSPDGSVLAFGQPRARRRKLSIGFKTSDFTETMPMPIPRKGKKGDDKAVLSSQSLTDDAQDDLSLIPAMRKRSSKARNSKPLSRTPPMHDDEVQIAPLERAVENGGGPATPSQTAIVGRVGGATFDPDIFRLLAHRYSPLLLDSEDESVDTDSVKYLLDGLDKNAAEAESVNLPRLAQTWRVVRYAVSQEISNQIKQRKADQANPHSSKGQSIVNNQIPKLEEPLPNKTKSRLFKGVIDGETQKLISTDTDGTSNATTPLVRPVPDSPISVAIAASDLHVSGLTDDLMHLKPLPPSVLTNNESLAGLEKKAAAFSRDLNSVSPSERLHSDVAPQTPARKVHRGRVLQGGNNGAEIFRDQTRSAPRAISGRAGWRIEDEANLGPSNQPENENEEDDEDFDRKVDEKRTALQDYKLFRKRLLSIDPVTQDSTKTAIPVTYARHDSSESFPMFSASTDSSHRAKSFGEASSSPFANTDTTRFEGPNWSSAERPLGNIPELEGSSPPRYVRWKSSNESLDGFSLDDLQPRSATVHLERPAAPLPFLAVSAPLKQSSHKHPTNTGSSNSRSKRAGPPTKQIPSPKSNGRDLSLPLSPTSDADTPWSLHTMVREIIRHYCKSTSVDLLSATHILQKMHVLFSSCEEILPYEERELIFQTFNEVLLRQGMLVEAAELRLLCVPTYPAVYDYAQKDTFINVFCFECNKPYENTKRDNRLCQRCSTPQPPCTICMSQNPPPEWSAETSTTHTVNDSTSASTNNSSPISSSHPRSQSRIEPTSPNAPTIDPSTTKVHDFQDDQPNANSIKSRPYGASLWSWCQGCGHGAHTACLTVWLNDIAFSEGGCPTSGCFHDCGPGPRREENRIAQQEASKRARDMGYDRKTHLVKRDSWIVGESKAVQSVGGMLGNAAMGHLPPPTAAAIGGGGGGGPSVLASPKKVRVFAPGDQRRG